LKVERVFAGEKEIVFVGTAHISSESVEQAIKTIEEERPDAVGVELDYQRYNQLLQGEQWREMDISKVIASGQTYLLLVNLLLANIQRSLGEKVGVKPGTEMLEAVKKANELGIPVELLDRDIKTTFSRAVSHMGFIEKIKFAYFVLMGFFGFGSEEFSKKKIDELKNTDLLHELMTELGKQFPSIKKVVVDERDEFIAGKIRLSKAKKIVAVIGLGHLEGVKQFLSKEPELEKLLTVKKSIGILSIIKYAIPVIFIAMILYAFLVKGIEVSLGVFLAWFLIHGILSALGVLLARGHLVSAATAFVAAPFTALHPLLAAGWFAGIAEAKKRNPKIKDFEELRNLNSFSDLSRNQVTRILLVVTFANIGSTVATIIAFPIMAKLLLG